MDKFFEEPKKHVNILMAKEFKNHQFDMRQKMY